MRLQELVVKLPNLLRTSSPQYLLSWIWAIFWMRCASLLRSTGFSKYGRIPTRLAILFMPPYKARNGLALVNPHGYVSPSAAIHHTDLQLERHVFLGDRVTIFQHKEGGPVRLGERVYLHNDCTIEVDRGGSVEIGAKTHIQPRCQFTSLLAPIQIGRGVQIAPGCAFYSYDHSILPDRLISEQPCETKGAIVIGDDAWLGYGVVVLSGVRIGAGAVIGAGSVVTHNIPDGAIAVGSPARVVKMRRDLVAAETLKPEQIAELVN